ncbi:OPT family oligopeptide transporter, partial [Thermococci archaeon]
MEEPKRKHPSAFEPGVLVLNIIMAVLGAIIGLELITRLGISTNTSIIGALIAILLARIPVRALKAFLDLNRQNLVQTAISGATFGAANAIFLPVGVAWLLGREDLLVPMWIGATLAAIIDMTMIYWLFDTRIFPAKNPWPPGIATAETLIAAAKKGKRAMLLLYGMIAGGIVRYLGIPADIAGVAWIGNMWALAMFGIGLIVRGYSPKLIGVDINQYYVPHGI